MPSLVSSNHEQGFSLGLPDCHQLKNQKSFWIHNNQRLELYLYCLLYIMYYNNNNSDTQCFIFCCKITITLFFILLYSNRHFKFTKFSLVTTYKLYGIVHFKKRISWKYTILIDRIVLFSVQALIIIVVFISSLLINKYNNTEKHSVHRSCKRDTSIIPFRSCICTCILL